uniref:Uncharacterized protein n=1 Tax=Anguilla anguilla TaxID=7936 RepID=A0A0E9XCZ3_ANGAN
MFIHPRDFTLYSETLFSFTRSGEVKLNEDFGSIYRAFLWFHIIVELWTTI